MFGSACDKSNPIQSLANLLLLSDQDILDACFYCECAFHRVTIDVEVVSTLPVDLFGVMGHFTRGHFT